MQHQVVHRPGGYERLQWEQAPDPVAGPGELLIGVEAVGVNYADCVVRMGLYASAKEYVGWPITPGFDIAGRVRAVGEGVRGWSVGEECFGVTRFNAYATHVSVPAWQVLRRPQGLSARECAALPTVLLTAWYALHHQAAASPGARVLVHSAAGGVGGALLQLCRAHGCHSLGVVGGAHKVELARELGAEAVVDKRSEDVWAAAARFAPAGFDAIFDANGGASLRRGYRALAPQGRLVTYGAHSMLPKGRGRPNWLKLAWDYVRAPRFLGLDLSQNNKAVLGFNLSFLFARDDLYARAMGELVPLLESGALRVPPIQTFPLERAADAQRALESGETVGKLVLEVDSVDGAAGA